MYWMNYKKIYFTLSGVFLIISIFSLVVWKLKLGIDFTGGSVIEYKLSKNVENSQLTDKLKEIGVTNLTLDINNSNTLTVNSSPLSQDLKSKVNETLKSIDNNIMELRYEVVGPTIGPELVQKTIYALILSASLILLWVAYQFKNIKYGLAATLATLHDSLVLLGSFSLMGHFWGVEIDFLFVTAMLTILSFSVHDTIVVFDRIREVSKKTGGDLTDIANTAVTQTMVRSLNNSFTIIFMLVALVLLGGQTIKWFAVALLIGTISGTYSSPFVAVPLLVTFDKIKEFKFKFRR
jgi:preprotein translocase subunit SecF